jgi:hypothetical protein
MTGCYVHVNGATWPLLAFLQGRAAALALPQTRGRALVELVATVVALAALEDAQAGREVAA